MSSHKSSWLVSNSSRNGWTRQPGQRWVSRAIVGLGAACVALAGLLVVAILSREPADNETPRTDAEAESPLRVVGSASTSRRGESTDEAGMGMSGSGMSGSDAHAGAGMASDEPYDEKVSARIHKELDSLDWATPKAAETAATPTAAPDTKPLVGRDWLPRVTASSGNRQEVLAVSAAIDGKIDERLQAVGISSSPPAADAEFHRRAYLDLHGHIPPVDKTLDFLADTRPDKRARLIDELLAHQDFGFRMAHYWRDLLLKRDPDKKNLPNEPVFVSWMARQYNHGQPWDKIVRSMLTAEGDEALAGETFFILTNEDDKQPAPNKIVATTAALFMGIQLQCAECHVHPTVEQWKPDDFWGLAAFFVGTRAERQDAGKGKGVEGTADLTQRFSGKGVAQGQISIPDPKNDGRTIGVAKAHLFESDRAAIDARGAKRKTIADWLASADDPYFAPAAVNRLWSIFFARGLVEPLDDLRPDNPPTHPELLTLLTNEFVASSFDVKHLVRCLCNSQAYQRTSRPVSAHDDNQKLLAHMSIKVLSPEMLFDSLAMATGGRVTRNASSSSEFRGTKGSPFAKISTVEFFDNREYDESSSEYTYGIPQLLRLMNHQLTAACEDIGQSEAAKKNRDKTVERMYLAAYSRPPTVEEVARINKFLTSQRSNPPAKNYSAVMWALLNSAEFFSNH